LDIVESTESVQTRQDLAAFALELREDLIQNEARWENPTLERFLEAFAAWCTDMPGYFSNRGEQEPPQPSWNLVANMLMAASEYE